MVATRGKVETEEPASPPPTGQSSRTTSRMAPESEAPAPAASKTWLRVIALNVMLVLGAMVIMPVMFSESIPSMITLSMPSCSDCDAATPLGSFEGNGVAVDYANFTFRVKDSEAAAAFIASPEEAIPVSTKMLLWVSPSYWSADANAHVCSCA